MISKGFRPTVGIACVVNALFLLIAAGFGSALIVDDYAHHVRVAGFFWATAYAGTALATLHAVLLPAARWQTGVAYLLNGLLLLCGMAPRLTAFPFLPNEQVVMFAIAVVNFAAMANKSSRHRTGISSPSIAPHSSNAENQ